MTGYMNDIIFSRVLGHNDIEQGAYWSDGTQCWLCNKWSKVQITYHPHQDKKIFEQKSDQIEKLHNTISNVIQKHFFKRSNNPRKLAELSDDEEFELIKSPSDTKSSCIEEVPEELELTSGFNTMRDADGAQIGELAKTEISGDPEANEEEKASTVFSGDIVTSVDEEATVIEEVEKPHNERVDNTSPMSPVKPKRQEKIL